MPIYDADGNQTLVKTSAGIWLVQYNAENRPILFTRTKEDGGITEIACTYDSMGRRSTKKVTHNGSVTLHQRYIYRGYLQIAACDLNRANHPCLWLILWDPTQPVATRPLAIQKDGTWYCYGWDLTKNICEVFGLHGYIRTTYAYTPYGAVTADGDVIQPLQWSSEYADEELGLTYYNYRHYNSTDGRWLGRDKLQEYNNISIYVSNSPILLNDKLGLFFSQQRERKLDEISIHLSATGSRSLVPTLRNPTVGGLIKQIHEQVSDCECIKELQLLIHANKEFLQLNSRYNSENFNTRDDRNNSSGRISENNASFAFSQLTKREDGSSLFCKNCIIYMESCHLGLGNIPQIIANETKCIVRAALGYSGGKPWFPHWSRSRKNVRGLEDPYPDLSKDGYELFAPEE